VRYLSGSDGGSDGVSKRVALGERQKVGDFVEHFHGQLLDLAGLRDADVLVAEHFERRACLCLGHFQRPEECNQRRG
jgi:hypothetical protein